MHDAESIGARYAGAPNGVGTMWCGATELTAAEVATYLDDALGFNEQLANYG